MAVSSIDYEKVDQGLLQILQMIKSMEQMVSSAQQATPILNTNVFINALDDYRNEVALEIEKQGKR